MSNLAAFRLIDMDVPPERLESIPLSHQVDDATYVAASDSFDIYVDGFPVVGLHFLNAGSLVSAISREEEVPPMSFFVVEDRGVCGEFVEDAVGQTCAFSGLPLKKAIRCTKCGRAYDPSYTQMEGGEFCLCGARLTDIDPPRRPRMPKELT